ncbi:hypothetical protein ACZ87_00891 [Candidatus Erwinia dacicola]|uniref:Uncharacterized protein n=1 Tax=Candidatus Erwinia dacicola TaxID=252393 RepID=A0A328TRV4_9GAMM|nr:hypothetical protein ACZ87_00891 [Candidatus Erwinia dacicola]
MGGDETHSQAPSKEAIEFPNHQADILGIQYSNRVIQQAISDYKNTIF